MPPAELQHLLSEVVRLGGAPGAAIGLSLSGTRTISTAGSAISSATVPLTLHSRLQLGCIGKLMTAIVALELAAGRRLDLHASIDTYLPELKGTSLGRDVQPWHLMTHTSGYRGPNIADPSVRYYYTWEKLVALLRRDERLFDPGTFFNYDHTESVLLGEIVERATHTDIVELQRAMVLAPAGIASPPTSVGIARDSIAEHSFDEATRRFMPLRAAPHCAFWRASLSDSTLSLEELLKLAEAAAGLDSRRVFRDQTVLMLREPRVWLPACLGGSLREEIPSSFGCGCAQYGAGVFGHNGSARGQTCALRYDPRSKVVAVVALNAWRPHVRDMLCRKVVPGTGDSAAPSDELPPHWVFEDTAGSYAGAAGTSAEVHKEPGQIVCTLRANNARKTARLVVTSTNDGRLNLASDIPQLTLGFSKPDAPGARLMMTGLNTYRRVG